MTYNLSFVSNSTGPLGLVQGIGSNVGSEFFGGFLLFVWGLLFVLFRNNGVSDAFMASSFVVSVLAGVGFGVGVLAGWLLVLPVTLLVLSVIVKIWSGS